MKRKLNAGFALRVTLLQLDNMAGALPAEHARLSLRVSRTLQRYHSRSLLKETYGTRLQFGLIICDILV